MGGGRKKRAVALVIECCRVWKEKTKGNKKEKLSVLSTEKLDGAEKWIAMGLQRAHFAKEIKTVKTKNIRKPNERQEVIEKSSRLRKLNIFMDEQGLLRAGSRLMNAETLQYDIRCPIVLPREDKIVEDLVRFTHEGLMHGGKTLTRNVLKEKYHIINDGM